ncbi:hypothetical protein ARMGADRAFT_1038388 [Armillaria gallica]|uniref:Uncharacterized protein n=1 Tax=Armillaria gallica TaxID=47427 RepID=A0A2H3CHZ1_ARMGA|nr:hypothetical protein ARMGADRAFT_1038388 [Armillaria gallica]
MASKPAFEGCAMVFWLDESTPASSRGKDNGNKVARPKERPKDDFEGLEKSLSDEEGVDQAGVPHPGHREKEALYAPHAEPSRQVSSSLKPKNEGPVEDLAADAPESVLDFEDANLQIGIGKSELDEEAGSLGVSEAVVCS